MIFLVNSIKRLKKFKIFNINESLDFDIGVDSEKIPQILEKRMIKN